MVPRKLVNGRQAADFDHGMELALAEARGAGARGDIPIGAVVMDVQGAVIAAAGNRREVDRDPTAHAEVLALRQAAENLGDWRLGECTLVVTVEPCPMCAGAAVLARVDRLVIGAWNETYGAAGSRWDLVRDRRLNHQIEVVSGIRADECAALLQTYLADRRSAGIDTYSGD